LSNGSSNSKKPCIYGLHSYCIVYRHIGESNSKPEWGSEEWVKLHCSLCIKATYAKAKIRLVKGYSVVNTL